MRKIVSVIVIYFNALLYFRLLASLPLILPRQESKVLLPPSDPLHIISDSLLHQVCKSMDEAELKELGFQLGISQERFVFLQ